jgi:hypothetical protein
MTTTLKGKCATGLGVGPTTIYTVPAVTTTLVIGLSLSNINAGTITAGARMTDSSAPATAYIGGKAFSLPAGAAEWVVSKDAPLILETGDSISIDGNTAASIDYTLSYVEMT